MGVNNETGVIQPISEITEIIQDHDCYFHVDAAQMFGKDIDTLSNKRIDLISISGHKIFGPKGIGALVTRLRNFNKPPLTTIIFWWRTTSKTKTWYPSSSFNCRTRDS